ncbi:MAG: hypothetical protein ABIO71_06905 [Caldimonas sp.]
MQTRYAPISRWAAVAVAAGLSACASTPQLDAQWRDPGLGGSYLRGARVLVACDAYEVVIRQICQDRLASEVVARGATPVFVPPETPIATDRSVDAQLLPAARSAGAKAMMVMTVAVAVKDVSPGFSIGIGGFGFGRHSGVGVGVDAPIGGGRVTSGYSANGRVTDVANGRLVWTAKATSPASSDVAAQMGELSKAVLGAADKDGLF